MLKIRRKTNTLLWVAIGTILLVGITFASIFYYQKSIAVPVYKTAVTVNATMQEDLSKVVKGDTVIRKASFTTHTDSGDIYVRANIRYYVNSTMSSDTKKFLLAVNYKDITTATGTDYKWVRGEDEYYYLTDTSGNPLKVSGGSATEYTICEGVTYTGPVSILDSVEAPSDLRLKLEVQTINTKNITTTTLDSIALNFKEDFGNNYTLGYIVTFDTDNAGSCPAQVFLTNDGTVTRPEEPSKVGYIFKGWYSDSNYNTEYTFTNKVTSYLTLYAKFVEGKTVTITKDINITSVTVTTNGETISSGDLVPVGEVLSICATATSGYKAKWTVTNDNTIIVDSPTSVIVSGTIIITITSAEKSQGTLSSSYLTTLGITDKSTVSTITFYDTLSSVPSTISSTTEYDLTDSTTTSTGKVLGYKVANANDSSLYDLHIASDDVIKLPKDCSSLFSLREYNSGYVSNLTAINNFDIVDGGDVTKINSMFSGCSSLTGSITIPDNVTSIGSYAFYGCSSLTSITIPDSVTSVGGSAFSGCSSLTSITIPDSVTSVGDNAFSGCSSLTSITIPDSVTSIDYSAFDGCTGLQNTEGGLIYIKANNNDYYYLQDTTDTTITSVTINENCKLIGYGAFNSCSSLTSITIPDSVTSISPSAFYGCSSLTSITIPSSVTSIGYSAFDGCTGLQNTEGDLIYIKTTTNDYYYLQAPKNTTLTSATIKENCKFIEFGAFLRCSSLTSVTIPSSVTSIGGNAFNSCSGLTSIIVDSGNTIYDSRDNCNAIIETASNILIAGCKNTVIPNSVTSIGDSAFYGCSSLTSIKIPNGVTSIGNNAFSGCSSLTSITIPDSVTSIGYTAFYGCSSLTSITIPDSVTSIDSNVFYGCSSLTSITIPSSVTSIGNSAFYNCSKLTNVTFEDTSGWFVADSSTATSGTDVILTDTTQNATYLTSTYCFQYWIKKSA